MIELILLNFSEFKFLGTPFYDADDFWKLVVKTIFN